MNLIKLWRSLWPGEQLEEEAEPPLAPDEDPFSEPVVIEIRDVIDLHSIPPKQINEIVEEYLQQARVRGFPHVRIIHGKGIGVQREAVRKILGRTPFVTAFYDAPPQAGGLGATIAELDSSPSGDSSKRPLE
jgi:dsDNA-specific endonuclease/ATPase MutS2